MYKVPMKIKNKFHVPFFVIKKCEFPEKTSLQPQGYVLEQHNSYSGKTFLWYSIP